MDEDKTPVWGTGERWRPKVVVHPEAIEPDEGTELEVMYDIDTENEEIKVKSWKGDTLESLEYDLSGTGQPDLLQHLLSVAYDRDMFRSDLPEMLFLNSEGPWPKPCRAVRDAREEEYEAKRCTKCGVHPNDLWDD